MNPIALLELFSLQGRVALVTGSSRGIGHAIARGLASAGASIALHGRSVEKLEAVKQELTALGVEVETFAVDLSDSEVIPTLVEQVIQRFGRIDILVNCAGMNRRLPIEEVTPPIYDEIMSTNLRSPYFLSQAVYPHMVAQGGGKIIHVGSLTTSAALASVSVYGMTKSALGQLTKTMAIEWAENNIQVNCLCPGFIQTDLTEAVWNDPQRSKWILDRLPLKRPGKPADLVGMAIYLAAPASDYMTGQAVFVDGGFMAGSKW